MCMSECVRTCVRACSFEVDVIESRAYDICEKSVRGGSRISEKGGLLMNND